MEAGAAKGDGGAGACAASELPDPQDAVAAQTDGTPAVQPCEHFSLRGYVALVKKTDPKFCSLSQIFKGQQRFAEHHINSRPFSVPNFPRWDCSKCLDKEKMADQGATSRTVPMGKNVTSDGCSIKFVRSALVPTSVDFRSLFPCENTCTQQLSQGKNADRSTLLKSTTPEGNSKCNSPCGVAEANTSSPKKDLQRPCNNPDATANISDNASVDVMAIPEDSHIRASRDGNSMAIPSSPKFPEPTLKPNAEETIKTNEVPNVVCTTPNFPKPVSGQKGDQVCNSGHCEQAAPARNVRSMKKGKSTARVDGPVIKIGKKKRRKRKLSEIIKEDQAGGSGHGIGVDADLCEEDRSAHDDPSGNWVKNVPKKTRTEKKDTTTTSAQQGDGSIEISNLERNMQSTDDMSPTEAEHSTQRSISKVKTMSKRKMTSTANVQHDSVVLVSHQSVAGVSSKIANKSKHNGVDVVVEEPLLRDWTKNIPKKLRTGRKDSSRHKGFDASSGSKKNVLPATSTQQGDENVHTNNLERNLQNTDGICQIESENCTQRSLSKANSMSLSNRKIPSAVNAQQGNANAENGAILWRDDQCQMESGSSVQQRLSKVSLGKRGIQHVTTLDKKMPKKKKKQKQEAMHGKQAVMDDDIVELVARNQDERSLINETDSSQSKISEDEDCIIISVKDGPNNVSVLDTTSQQKLSAPEIYQNALQDHAAATTQATSMHPLELQIAGNINSAQEPRTHLSTEVVTIARTSPLLSQYRDQSSTEALANCWSHEESNKSMWDSFKKAPRDSSTPT
ncbi:hypothetical protein BRADI_2g07710v3 [Brachypodium distachyon]|nr:hypothetical protein BRADI_2g07710v3 [Brachypodium distachyon]